MGTEAAFTQGLGFVADFDLYLVIEEAMLAGLDLRISYNGTVRIIKPVQLTSRTELLATQLYPQPGTRKFFVYRIEAIEIIRPEQTGAYNVISETESREPT